MEGVHFDFRCKVLVNLCHSINDSLFCYAKYIFMGSSLFMIFNICTYDDAYTVSSL